MNRTGNMLSSSKWLLVCVVGLTLLVTTASGELSENATNKCEDEEIVCRKGVMLPLWTPTVGLSTFDKLARATVYFAGLAFMFLGVSIIADRFMASIEVITSQERQVTVRIPGGETTIVNVRIWNETVSNLTLMALGSSAPEILLSIIEIIGNNFKAGALGPGTIVGSAAFNLFIIIGICVYVVPNGEVRRIKHLGVFLITSSWSIFAYLWMYLIIAAFSPGEVEVWEGVVTFLFFPLTVGTAYMADRRVFFYKFLSKRYRASRGKTVVVSEGDVEMNEKTNHLGEDILFKGLNHEDAEIREFERHRKEFIEILRELRKKHPNYDMAKLEEMAEFEVMNRGPKSRAFYRIQATRKLTGGGNVIKKNKMDRKASMADVKVDLDDDNVTRIFFEPGHYTVMENIGTFHLTVTRQGGNLHNTVYVDYKSEDGTANAGSDYEYAEGTLVFQPGETHKQFPMTIIDDDIFEEDEHFYVRLTDIRVGDLDGVITGQIKHDVQLANPSMATVMILDDDHSGIFHFELKETTFPESIGEASIKVTRSSGARGCVKIPYRTIEGTAKGNGQDYEDSEGELTFKNDETEGFVKVRIIDDEEYEKTENFYIELGEPRLVATAGEDGDSENGDCGGFVSRFLEGKEGTPIKEEEQSLTEKRLEDMTEDERIAELGRPRLGDHNKVTCHIRESMEFKSTVDKLLKKANVSLVVGTSSWREQFIEAITVSAGDDDIGDDDEEAEEKLPSCMDYVMHFLTIFWKVLFAFVPPTDYWGGWACFCVSISGIGLLTALIGDLASGFGCTIGLKDAVTAITFVALGTSLPDTFASKVAAIGDQYADSSVGNVTGSNAVNVFLGIGIAWTIAAVKHRIYNETFTVDPGNLAFNLTIFTIFAFFAIGALLIRRRPSIGGELGGPTKYRIPTCMFFGFLWLMYVILSSLESYCHITSF